LLKFSTEIDGGRCKGCELCVQACPLNIIKLDDVVINAKGYRPAYVTEPEKCVGCSNCALMCPDGAIKIFKHEEGDA
jgi:2-oxoglutarate ferredoxin oxidoreductase subunit delta